YSGQYTITNPGTAPVSGWTLAFTLPPGTKLTSLWGGTYTDDGGQVTVQSAGWDATVEPGQPVTVGFVTGSSGAAGQPAGCTINGAVCQGTTGPAPSASSSSSSPSSPPGASPTPSRSAPPSPTRSAPAASSSASSAPNPSAGAPAAGAAGFAPYVDTSLFPQF